MMSASPVTVDIPKDFILHYTVVKVIHNHALQDINIHRHERPILNVIPGFYLPMEIAWQNLCNAVFKIGDKAIALELVTTYDGLGGGVEQFPILQAEDQ